MYIYIYISSTYIEEIGTVLAHIITQQKFKDILSYCLNYMNYIKSSDIIYGKSTKNYLCLSEKVSIICANPGILLMK